MSAFVLILFLWNSDGVLTPTVIPMPSATACKAAAATAKASFLTADRRADNLVAICINTTTGAPA